MIRAAPTSSDAERDVIESLERGVVLILSAYDEYSAAIESGRIDRLDAGDRAFDQGQAAINDAREDSLPLQGPETGAAGAIRSLGIRVGEFQDDIHRARGLERRFFRQWEDDSVPVEAARRSAAQASQAYRIVAESYAAISATGDERVDRIVAKTAEGYALTEAAFSDYVRALDEGKQSLLVRGDKKYARGARMIQEAASDLTAYASELGGL